MYIRMGEYIYVTVAQFKTPHDSVDFVHLINRKVTLSMKQFPVQFATD